MQQTTAGRVPTLRKFRVVAMILSADKHGQAKEGAQKREWFLVLLHVPKAQMFVGEMVKAKAKARKREVLLRKQHCTNSDRVEWN